MDLVKGSVVLPALNHERMISTGRVWNACPPRTRTYLRLATYGLFLSSYNYHDAAAYKYLMEGSGADSAIYFRPYVGESDLPSIMALVQSELSEPYVIYTYRYFLQQWPHLSFLAYSSASMANDPIGVIVCKQSVHRDSANRGYIAMLSVNRDWRKRGIARSLVQHSIDAMKGNGVEEVVLETEFDNSAALSLYESLGFIREKRLYRFYMNGKDAFRLILAVPPPPALLGCSGASSPSSSYSDSDRPTPLIRNSPNRRSNIYNVRVLPEYIAGFDDSDDEVSMR